MHESQIGRIAMPVLVAACWWASLPLPAGELDGGQVQTGFSVLSQGWQAARFGIVSWFANPLFVLALFAGLLKFRRVAFVLSGVTLFLALTSFAAAAIAREAGVPLPGLTLLYGFYIWLAAQLVLFAWSVLQLYIHEYVANELHSANAVGLRD